MGNYDLLIAALSSSPRRGRVCSSARFSLSRAKAQALDAQRRDSARAKRGLNVRLCGGRGNVKIDLQIANCPSGHPQQPMVRCSKI